MLNFSFNRSLHYKLGTFTKQWESNAAFMQSQQYEKNWNSSLLIYFFPVFIFGTKSVEYPFKLEKWTKQKHGTDDN